MTETTGPQSASQPAPRARLRRQPQQARSRARVEAVLAAADRILSQEGYEALTMRRIAEESGAPVGSIYQFYPDKAAVVDALGHRYLDAFRITIDDLVDRAVEGGLPDLVDTMVDVYAELFRTQPGGMALWAGRHLSPELARADETSNALIAEGLRRIVEHVTGTPGGERLRRATRMVVWAANAVLHEAFKGDGEPDLETVEELKRMLNAYWADLRERSSAAADA
ncbi:TetR/AcrR family transcriptional regulator [Streptomyces roseicoloratus]|uniref:TetR/AcrR family transcriptional regulator n=1 Tax=Streptomyces roseicoloratus TaxID=2508722 RepID=A0ABY9RQP4_9ACTN|nr:TetR/AcrR family transcriptional regulator [Streptomyces roseicoloratus]WMX44023.1 TetR/AcrR family transcriptional regulator [Streptomyces roseicoloratus]